MNDPRIVYRGGLDLEPGDEVTAMTTFEGVVLICTKHGRLYTMVDGQPVERMANYSGLPG